MQLFPETGNSASTTDWRVIASTQMVLRSLLAITEPRRSEERRTFYAFPSVIPDLFNAESNALNDAISMLGSIPAPQ